VQGSPKISIGMPVYNGELYIKEAIESLLSQTFTDFELIISDNASSDGTKAICESYAARDSRISYVHHPVNKGAALNYQFTVNKAAGEYFMFASYDDVWNENFIDVLVREIEKNEKLIAVYFKIIGIDSNGDEYGRRSEIVNTQALSFSDATLQLLFHGPPDILYALWKKEVIKEMMNSVYDNVTETTYCDLLAMSHALTYIIPAYGDIATVDQFLFKERKHGNASDSHIGVASYSDIIKYFRILNSHISKKGLSLSDKMALFIAIARQTSFVGLYYGPNNSCTKRFFKFFSTVSTRFLGQILERRKINFGFFE